MIININLGENSYDIFVERGILARAKEHLNLNRRVLVVTDDGVPKEYARAVADQCKESVIYTLPAGEDSKSFDCLEKLLKTMLYNGFSRKDCVVAVGGGVVGDLAGFGASTYMRGVDFYNIPTTLLAQLDSSVGGKVGVDFKGYKNLVGAFYQPKKVLIDPDVLQTLDPRQLRAGAAEAVKIGLTMDEGLFALFESGEALSDPETVIARAVRAKALVVAQDETESGLRRVLNFGHTVGHGIESACNFSLLHGECVGLGMLAMVSEGVRPRLLAVLKNLGLPTESPADPKAVLQAMAHDKKRAGDSVTVVRCPAVGKYSFDTLPFARLEEEIQEVLG